MLVGREGLRKVVTEIAGKVPMSPQAIGAGFAGARGKKEMDMARGVLRQAWPRATKVVVGQDTDSALGAAWGVEDGFLVIAGTGSNVVGRVKGRKYGAGGHGHILGDAGSGYDLAQRAIRSVLRERDREGKAPALAATLMAHSGAGDLDHLVREVYRAHGKEWLAGFAPGILRAAERRDPLACRVVRASALELAEMAGELAKRVGVRRPRWALTGGLFQNGFYRQSFVRALRGIFSGTEISVLKIPGEVGAARMVAGSSLRVGEEVDVERPLVSVETLPTERTNPRSRGLHKKSVDQLVRLFVEEEAFTVRGLRKASGEIKKAAEIVSRALQQGGRLFYVGAGTSGRLGVLDASEMPPTFHAPPEQVQAILAGGPEAIFRAQEGAEDDAEAGKRSVYERRVGKRDVLVGLTASGRTPFVHGALREGCRLGTATVLVTAHPNWSPVKGGIRPQAVVRLDVGPELIAGSTRLKAGTVTKMACNILSSVAMIRLGRVFDNLMVNVVPSNEKLHARAIQLIRALTKTGVEEARKALHLSGGKVTVAVERLKKVSRLPRKR
jgi:N-acetylmuramic acid 6-phosphate etherase